jgi:dTMP kinase
MFITFEGPEGAGKSTQLARLAGRLRDTGRNVVMTREPGGGTLGPAIRALLLEGEDVPPRAELFLFLADRAAHVQNVVRPAIARGDMVLCDRHADSTVVYQGHGRGMDVDELRSLNAMATEGLVPDLTLLFDLTAEQGLARLNDRDRLDREPLAFHQRVRQGFLAEAEREPERWVVFDARQDVETLDSLVWAEIQRRFSIEGV